MVVRKLSVAIDEAIAEAAAQSAERAGLSLSAWLTQAAEKQLKIELGLAAVRQFEEENGPFTEEERRWADEVLDRVERRRRRKKR